MAQRAIIDIFLSGNCRRWRVAGDSNADSNPCALLWTTADEFRARSGVSHTACTAMDGRVRIASASKPLGGNARVGSTPTFGTTSHSHRPSVDEVTRAESLRPLGRLRRASAEGDQEKPAPLRQRRGSKR